MVDTARFHKIIVCLGVLILMSGAAHAFVDRKEIKTTLSTQYQKKILVVHGFYAGPKLRFNSTGEVLTYGKKGYWSSDGLLEVRSISFEKNGTLLISGKRVMAVFDRKTGKFTNHKTGLKLDVEIETDSRWDDVNEFKNVVDKVFSSDLSDLAATAPAYWSCWLSGTIENADRAAWKCADKKANTAAAGATNGSEPNAVHVGAGVTPPRLISSPDPVYTDIARKERFQGTTVLWVKISERGEPTEIRIARPLGAGLDDMAVEAVRTWQFAPAMKEGRPVAVQVNVEVNFRIY